MRERTININFDEEGRGPAFAGSIVRLNECVNVVKIQVEQLDDPHAAMQISMKRADGRKGTALCEKVTEEGRIFFRYPLSSWATAVEGDLRVSFALIYSEPYEQEIESGVAVDVYPVDYQRLVTLRVEPAVGKGDELVPTPDAMTDLIAKVTSLEEGVLNVGVINAGEWR